MLLNGEGTTKTAAVTSAQWEVSKSGAASLSVYNTGANDVWVLANCTTAEFDVLYAAGKAIRVRSGLQYNFNGSAPLGGQNIKSVCYQTAASTSEIDMAAL